VNQKILINPEVLLLSYLPEKLLHRDEEIAQISHCFSNFINTFVYGSLGSGKTAILKYTISDFNTRAKGKAVYIDCSLYKTVNAALREILAGISSLIASKSNYELIKRLKEKVKHHKLILLGPF
jgi:cell division control protein 6